MVQVPEGEVPPEIQQIRDMDPKALVNPESKEAMEEWLHDVDDISAKIKGICEGSFDGDYDEFDRELDLKRRAKEIKEEELKERLERHILNGQSGKGEGDKYKWWCRGCHVEYQIDLPGNKCTRCEKLLVSQQDRRAELLLRVEDYKKEKAKHSWRKDKWLRWKKSQKMLGKSRVINYKTWEYWEPETESENETEPIVPKDNPEFQAMEADIKQRNAKHRAKKETAERFRVKGNACMTEHDYIGAIEHYEEGLEYQKDNKILWNNKALAELKVFRFEDAVTSTSRVLELAEIFEDGFTKSKDACLKAFLRRATALRGLQKWSEALEDLKDALQLEPKDKEARTLHAKTKVAAEEARRARRLLLQTQAAEEEERVAKEAQDAEAKKQEELRAALAPTTRATTSEECSASSTSTTGIAPLDSQGADESVVAPDEEKEGPIRVAIEESDEEEEDDEEGPGKAGYSFSPLDRLRQQEEASSPSSGSQLQQRRKKKVPKFGSLSELKERDFKELLDRLHTEEDFRILFTVRASSAPEEVDVAAAREQMRSRKAKVEEVVERSALDVVLKDLERCCVLWKKQQGTTVIPLHHTDGVKKTQAEEAEEKEAKDFVAKIPQRALAILHTLACNSDHFCELSATGVKFA